MDSLRQAAQDRGAEIGRVVGPLAFLVTGSALGALAAAGVVWTLWTVLAAVVISCLVIGVVMLAWPRFRAMRRQSIELLCSTVYARSKGYTPRTLRLHAWPWRRLVKTEENSHLHAPFTQRHEHG